LKGSLLSYSVEDDARYIMGNILNEPISRIVERRNGLERSIISLQLFLLEGRLVSITEQDMPYYADNFKQYSADLFSFINEIKGECDDCLREIVDEAEYYIKEMCATAEDAYKSANASLKEAARNMSKIYPHATKDELYRLCAMHSKRRATTDKKIRKEIEAGLRSYTNELKQLEFWRGVGLKV